MDAPLGRSVALCTRAEAAKRDVVLALTLIYFYGRIAGRGGPEEEEEGSQSVVDIGAHWEGILWPNSIRPGGFPSCGWVTVMLSLPPSVTWFYWPRQTGGPT